jgi:hypothetical protein
MNIFTVYNSAVYTARFHYFHNESPIHGHELLKKNDFSALGNEE